MLGSIVLMSQVFLRGMFYSSLGSRRRYSGSSKGGGNAQIVIMIIAIVAAILAPIFAQLLYFALSRKREYLADAGAARLTRYPAGLANALEKIANDHSAQLACANKVTAPMYIANPIKKKKAAKLSNLTSTHPPITERIKILRTMAGGASMKDYSKSFMQVTKNDSPLPAAVITDEIINIRKPSDQPGKSVKQQKQAHQLGDLMRVVNGFVFLTCSCGLKLKVPPNYKGKTVTCPKCKKQLSLKKSI
jgi:heat shock protein HtpX